MALWVPGGFGNRGTTVKCTLSRYARERDIPYLGLCLGMQFGSGGIYPPGAGM